MDADFTGSILSVVGAIVVVAFPGYKVSRLIARDAERHRLG